MSRNRISKTMDNDTTHRSILDFSKYCMILSGIWRLPLPTNNRALKKLYMFYSLIVHIYLPIFLVSLCIQVAKSSTSINDQKSSVKVFEQLSYMIGLVMITATAVLYQTKAVKEIIYYIINEDIALSQSKDNEVLQSHSTQVRFCKQSNFGVAILMTWMGISMIFVNYWSRLQAEKYNREHNASIAKPLPYDLYYYKLDKAEHASMLLALNDITVIVLGLLAASTKMFFFSCIIFPASILKRLQIRLRKVTMSEDVFFRLKECVLEHQRVMGFIGKLNDSVKYVIFLEYVVNALTIATVSVQLIAFDPKQMTYSIPFFGIVFSQSFVVGWSANEIKIQSSALADAIYKSGWYEQNVLVQKMLLTMMMKAHRPLVLTIGPFGPMTTQSAVAIVKGSYSYITVMMKN
ncbi:odorant receptor 30a-like [Cylas formicarius]|uniref:odorant receptor 30a-like n=1 Tax=Cylas formicarius TaxID=197179 RepID=UPI002958D971|nr:odorant receptor 30a-like [Cylas formicarius]